MRRPGEIHGASCRANAILLLDDGWSCARVAAAAAPRRRHDTDMVQALPDQAIGAGGLDEMMLFDGQGRRGHLGR